MTGAKQNACGARIGSFCEIHRDHSWEGRTAIHVAPGAPRPRCDTQQDGHQFPMASCLQLTEFIKKAAVSPRGATVIGETAG